MRAPAQVGWSVVGRIAVIMGYLHPLRLCADKRLGHKDMHKKSTAKVVLVKHNSAVT
jgi:hypothetical protein